MKKSHMIRVVKANGGKVEFNTHKNRIEKVRLKRSKDPVKNKRLNKCKKALLMWKEKLKIK